MTVVTWKSKYAENNSLRNILDHLVLTYFPCQSFLIIERERGERGREIERERQREREGERGRERERERERLKHPYGTYLCLALDHPVF